VEAWLEKYQPRVKSKTMQECVAFGKPYDV